MQSLNRKAIVVKALLILISILSIILIKEEINSVNSSMQLIKNMGGFDLYPIDSPDTAVQGWYYSIIANILCTLCSIIILILSVISIFVKNRVIHISIIASTALRLLIELPSNFNMIKNTIGYYQYIELVLIITLIMIIISAIKKKSLFIFYIFELVLFVVKFIDVYRFWYGRARGDISLLGWFNKYGIEYAIIAILGFGILILNSSSVTTNSSMILDIPAISLTAKIHHPTGFVTGHF